jgi:delta(3,5)-delta(2,4)-dienoyl-CoA isomerase
MASDVGSLARFPKTVGNDSLTREAGFTGRDFRAKEALGAGFLSRIVPGGREDVLRTFIQIIHKS